MQVAQDVVISAGKSERHYWQELWRYRELFRVLAWRDISVRYKQTVLGVTWAIIRPLLTMIIFTIIFGRIAKLPSQGAPYPLLVFAGTLPWMMFSSALSDASNSLVSNANLISKVYFPRLIVPTAAVMVSLIDFLINLLLLAILLIWYRYMPGWQLIFLPAFIALALVVTLGPSLWVSALNVKYRDVRFVIPFIVQLGLYVSPVGFSSNVIPDEWRLLYSLNPMAGVIDGFRWCILGGENAIYIPGLAISGAIAVVLFLTGVMQFKKAEKGFADLI